MEQRAEDLVNKFLVKSGGGYNCSVCEKYCRDKYNGKRHLEIHFPTKGAYTCNKCNQRFNTKRSMDNHIYKRKCKGYISSPFVISDIKSAIMDDYS